MIIENSAVKTVRSMIERNRLAHSFLLYGESGTGKKTLARQIAMMIMCETHTACGHCKPCKTILSGNNPDLTYARHSGVKNGFQVDEVRRISADAHIIPTSNDTKIYIFTDSDNMTIQAQNMLLKLVEEPPDYAYFIFTASARDIFLKTMLSRMISLGVEEYTLGECEKILQEKYYNNQQIAEAISCFGGNVGKCIEYLSDDGKLKETVEIVRNLTDSIARYDEYEIMKILAVHENDRDFLQNIFVMLNLVFRDAVVLKSHFRKLKGCYHEGAEKISREMNMDTCIKIRNFICEQAQITKLNVNSRIVSANFSAGIISIINS